MIARIWHGVTAQAKSGEYFDYMSRTGIPDYRATEGNRGVFVLRRIEEGESHFLLISLWQSIDAIKKFSGDDIQRARYYPEDAQYLLELEPHVQHYEIINEPEKELNQCQK